MSEQAEMPSVESLKVNRIVPPGTTPADGRRRLPTMGAAGVPTAPATPGPLPEAGAALPKPPDEVFGGSGEAAEGPVDPAVIEAKAIEAMREIYDPEIPVNIYELGLIYGTSVTPEGDVEIEMTLTAPACPVAGMLVQEVADKVGAVEGVRRSRVKLVWDPPWTMDKLSDEARLELGLL